MYYFFRKGDAGVPATVAHAFVEYNYFLIISECDMQLSVPKYSKYLEKVAFTSLKSDRED